MNQILSIPAINKYKIPFAKRAFDIVVSGSALLFLFPLFIIISILIKLSSKGPIFYKSKRVGANFRIFDFYKFRSMRTGADAKLKDLKHLNQYSIDAKLGGNVEAPVVSNSHLCTECLAAGIECKSPMVSSEGVLCEKLYKEKKMLENKGQTFLKIANDPRVFKFGAFMRNSSLDELPQLINVFIGDMSIVGNRPLPLYEAEKLTTDNYATRFLGPAGITGLWQVTKRGRGGPMSEEERIQLDNMYAENYSFWEDIKIMLRTVPALFQKENV
jgi:lipopolysaccharide/colanic/teichoic acid biosynthesis glycosyltransferase